MRRIVIGVMGAGDSASAIEVAHARELGERIATEGWVLLTGGRDAGVMAAANEGAKRVHGSLTVGILPFHDSGASLDVDVVIATDLGNGRNNVNILSSDVVIACGVSGPGTVLEIALALKNHRPLILLDADRDAVDFFSRIAGKRVAAVRSPEAAVALARQLLTGVDGLESPSAAN